MLLTVNRLGRTNINLRRLGRGRRFRPSPIPVTLARALRPCHDRLGNAGRAAGRESSGTIAAGGRRPEEIVVAAEVDLALAPAGRVHLGGPRIGEPVPGNERMRALGDGDAGSPVGGEFVGLRLRGGAVE